MRYALLILLCFIIPVIASGQDVITKTNGKTIECKILEENEDFYKYRPYHDGPILKISKDKVLEVKYGEVEAPGEQDSQLPDTTCLDYRSTFGGLVITRGGEKLFPNEVKEIYLSNPEIFKEYQRGRTLKTIGDIVGIPCAFVFGWQIGSVLSGAEYNGPALAIGGVGMLAGISLSYVGAWMIKNSVHLYNQDLESRAHIQLNMGISPHGIGICLKF